jgi:hypothetical protein
VITRSIKTFFCIALSVYASAAGTRTAECATAALDSASNLPAYASDPTGAWKGLNPTVGENPPGTDNGGFGFNTWDFSGGFQQPQYSPYGDLNHFIDGVDFPASTYNNLGAKAFGLTNSNFDSSACHLPDNCPFGGETARATRVFAQPLAVGSTVSMLFDNPSALTPSLPIQDRWFPAGILMRFNTGSGPAISGSTGVSRFEVFASTGLYGDYSYAYQWYLNDAATSVTGGVPLSTGVALTTTASGAKLSVTLLGPETYSMQLNRLSDGALLYSHSGSLESTGAGAIDTLEIALYGNGSGNGEVGTSASATGEREFFFNNLRIDSAGLSGDYNQDGIVNAADYVVWRKGLGTNYVQNDYNVWRAHFGESAGSGSNTVMSVTVPEPSTDDLIAVSLGLLMSELSSRRRHGVLGTQCDG